MSFTVPSQLLNNATLMHEFQVLQSYIDYFINHPFLRTKNNEFVVDSNLLFSSHCSSSIYDLSDILSQLLGKVSKLDKTTTTIIVDTTKHKL